MKKTTKIHIIRLICLTLVLSWMIVVFKFSNEPAKVSDGTSSRLAETIIKTFVNKNITEDEQKVLIEKINPIIRKLAHFSIYTIGGILILSFISTYNIPQRKKCIYSVFIGATYAGTDEFHQLFIEGRSGEISDVLLDSLGVVTGICIFLCVKLTIEITAKKLKLMRHRERG